MEAVRPLDENPDDLKLPDSDERTDLEELADITIKLRKYRRAIDKQVTTDLEKRIKGQNTSEDKSVEIAEMWKMYKYFEMMHISLTKICYPKGKTQGNGDVAGKPDMGAVKALPNSVGKIVTKITEGNG